VEPRKEEEEDGDSFIITLIMMSPFNSKPEHNRGKECIVCMGTHKKSGIKISTKTTRKRNKL
jgi:hypothetical protein